MLQTVENYNTELYWKIVLFSSLSAVGIQPMCYFEYSNLPCSIKRLVKAARNHDYKPFMNHLYESLLWTFHEFFLWIFFMNSYNIFFLCILLINSLLHRRSISPEYGMPSSEAVYSPSGNWHEWFPPAVPAEDRINESAVHSDSEWSLNL